MIIRLRSKDGNFRFDFHPSDSVSRLVDRIRETAPAADPASICLSNQPRGGETNVSTLMTRTLIDLGLRHGDLLFVSYKDIASAHDHSLPLEEPNKVPNGSQPKDGVKEDSVDLYWRQKDGKIRRNRDSRFCTHGTKAMCEYCSPLEPFDIEYHSRHSIKHLSFHAYLRKLSPQGHTTAATSSLPPLSPLSYRVKVPCSSGSHPPWPASICTACQPSAITLQPQVFRMVDHLEFASDAIIDRFLQAWRATGTQRFGWLVGHYEPYSEVPMGIKAVVEAIHEPPQEGEVDGVTVGLPWEDQSRIAKLLSFADPPLSIIGQIFTDLTPDEAERTKVIYKRHPHSFYLSSLETIFAATMQLQHHNPSASSPTGRYSSRFVTAVLSGTNSGGIDVSAYQVSEQACAMVDADMIEASIEPGIVRVKDEDRTAGSARYIPDVFFRYKNEYGREVQKSAKPAFPVEYLLVNVTHGFPKSPSPMFKSSTFPIESRPGLEDADLQKLVNEMAKNGALDVEISGDGSMSMEKPKQEHFLRWLNDWHLIAFIGSTGLLLDEDMKLLVRVATSTVGETSVDGIDHLLRVEGWKNLLAVARESTVQNRATPVQQNNTGENDIPADLLEAISNEEASAQNIRICPHCTYENVHSGGDCEVCGLPLG